MSEPTVTIPASHAVRLRTAETLQAELDGARTEISSLRQKLDETAWERDAAQQESAFMREEVLQLEPEWREQNPRVGQVLLSCDTWGDIPEPSSDYDDIALVSLSSGRVYVRIRGVNTWAEYGQDTMVSDYANLADKGPWVTVETWALRDHKAKADARRRFYQAKYDAQPYDFEWPDPDVLQRARQALAKATPADAGPAHSALGHLAGHTRAMWQQERDRANALQLQLAPSAGGAS